MLIFSCGSFFIYKIYIKSYKKEFRSFISDQKQDNLESHTIPLAQLYISSDVLKWEDENKEVILNGKLYDVIKTVIVNDQAILCLLPDLKEIQLKQEFASLYNDSAKSSSPFMNLLKQMLNLKFVSANFTFSASDLSAQIIFSESNFNLSEGITTNPFIPPSFS